MGERCDVSEKVMSATRDPRVEPMAGDEVEKASGLVVLRALVMKVAGDKITFKVLERRGRWSNAMECSLRQWRSWCRNAEIVSRGRG